jgi:D-alanyl-D-alanine carboxypeptidase
VDAYLDAYGDAGQFSGVVLIANGDQVIYSRALGFADMRSHRRMQIDTIFPLASLSKAFTGAAIVDLQRGGRVSFSDPLARAVPDFPNARNITVDQLLRHTSGVGLVEDPALLTGRHRVSDYLAAVAAAPPLFAPGKKDEYSNEGYLLLAAIVERTTGRSYYDYLRATFFTPLQMRSTGEDRSSVRRAWGNYAVLGSAAAPIAHDEAPMPGASGLQSTADDIYRWMKAIRAGRYGNFSALPYPYGWGRRTYGGQQLIEQSGSVEGFATYMALYENGYYIVALSNVQAGMQGNFGPDFAALTFEQGTPSQPPPLTLYKTDQDYAAIAGDYTNPGGGYTLHLRQGAGALEMAWGPYPFWRPVSPIGRDDFIAMADYTRIKVRRDPAGGVSGVVLTGLDGSEKDAPLFPRH